MDQQLPAPTEDARISGLTCFDGPSSEQGRNGRKKDSLPTVSVSVPNVTSTRSIDNPDGGESSHIVVDAAAEPLVRGEIRAILRHALNLNVVHVRPGLEADPSAFGDIEHTAVNLLSKTEHKAAIFGVHIDINKNHGGVRTKATHFVHARDALHVVAIKPHGI